MIWEPKAHLMAMCVPVAHPNGLERPAKDTGKAVTALVQALCLTVSPPFRSIAR
jgi:DNA-binding phage protein